ncbi:MAG: nitrite/sulfite reductase [Armatimonadetes bacterium]|nr:nitrite/sulfite reductase [Armatimonadota bacterium]MDW8121987.1 nitrite/sulfite reductase [Armatimonadota bacterium]
MDHHSDQKQASGPLPIPSWEMVLKRNSIERMKREKFPLDIILELPQLIAKGYEAIPEEDIVRLQWWGLYHDKPKIGTFMMRIKLPGGQVTPQQLRTIGLISEKFGKGYGEISTRQNIQLHWIRLDDLPEVLETLKSSGLTTAGGCGDTVRNITSCPVADVDRHQIFDVTPVLQEAARFFYGNRDYSDLPRKHKITIAACPAQCNAPEIHCIGLIGVIKDKREGFAVRIGGGLASTPRISQDMGVFVPKEEAIPVLRAIIDCWKENPRYRLSRVKARLKFMVDDYGPQEYRRMVEERLGRRLEDFQAPEPEGEQDHLGVHPQKQPGFFYAGFPVPVGWLTSSQMKALADVTDEVGAGIRLTRQQNFIITYIPENQLARLIHQVEKIGFPLQRNRVWGLSIACTGEPFCNYAVAETKTKLKEIVDRLEFRFADAVSDLKIHLDGCPHACGKHWVGDIGLQGTTARQTDATGVKIQAYDIILRGGLGKKTAIGSQVIRRVPAEEVVAYVERLVEAWLWLRYFRNGHRDGYTFRDFCDEFSDEDLTALAEGRLQITELILRRFPDVALAC